MKPSFPRPALGTYLREFLLITAGAGLLILSMDVFLAPADIAPGGVSGLAIILNDRWGWPIGLTMLVLNLPMLALGFRYLGRFQFLVRTAYLVLIYSLGVDMLAKYLPAGGISENALLNALYGGVVGGIGTGLVYRGGGSPAGTGILGRVIQLRTGMPISQVYLLTDGGVILLAALALGWEQGLFALLALFVWGLATDYLLEGPSVVRTAFIVTDHPDRVSESIMRRLGLGVTAWAAEGKYTQAEHTVLFCTVSRPDVDALRGAVTQSDPEAFLVIGHGHQATGGIVRKG
ncbi:MAG: hypothetical protein A2W26_01100 [Acidobacteria bacterium RBG_16_64_8]|nr:MAG: hypothetical protein A2W26_01100 [Acidobacteria bacterium RBG_16_64_8]